MGNGGQNSGPVQRRRPIHRRWKPRGGRAQAVEVVHHIWCFRAPTPRFGRMKRRGGSGERRRESEVGYGHLTTGGATGRHIPVR
jgi:hypothetical protein